MNLKKQNKILNDEINSMLLHFEEARGYKEKYESLYTERTQENDRSNSLFEQLNFDLEEAKRREMEYFILQIIFVGYGISAFNGT